MGAIGDFSGVRPTPLVEALSTAAPGEALRERVLRHPGAAGMLRLLGPYARSTYNPRAATPNAQIGALVAIPPGQTATSLGLSQVVPGIGRIGGSPEALIDFSDKHPDLHMEVSPPLKLNMHIARRTIMADAAFESLGADGNGVFVGVADTGIDVSHPEFLDGSGYSRIAWLIDMSLEPLGLHADLEEKYGLKDDTGKLIAGAVLTGKEIDDLIFRGKAVGFDPVGHGTHVSSIAAADGDDMGTKTAYRGVAPKAQLVVAGLSRRSGEAISNDDLLRGVSFIFDRADFEKKPVAVNLSLGGDFGPHDGSMLWEQTLAGLIGRDHPGRVLVAAAGNSGSVIDTPIHQSVRVTKGTRVRVPVTTRGSIGGGVQIWVALRAKTEMKIGLESPNEEWIPPIEEGSQRGKNGAGFNAGVIYGSSVSGSPIPAGSRGAAVLWSGKWPEGTYSVTLEGEGIAELYLQGVGDVAGEHPAYFSAGVREATVNLPATHPSILSVGCTINTAKWISIANGTVGLGVPILDPAGGRIDPSHTVHAPDDGDACWFSGAGPTITGVPKPEISAPGAAITAAMSKAARPGTLVSIFSSSTCPPVHKDSDDRDSRCYQVDETHAVAFGTSMSAPMVTGAAALLLQRDPTLTQEQVVALLQGGAHRFRGSVPFHDQNGPGELDIVGALDALDQMKNPTQLLPHGGNSWLTLSSDYAPADGSTPVTAIVELRTADGLHRADMFDAVRLQPQVLLDGATFSPKPVMERRGPGVYSYTVSVPPGHGGSTMTFAATFDGNLVVAPKSIPVAPDSWMASYPSYSTGGCATSRGVAGGAGGAFFGLLLVGINRLRRRRSAASHAAPTPHRWD
jgi:subtilisin family serine protease